MADWDRRHRPAGGVPRELLIVFVKAPARGKPKSRIARKAGEAAASKVYCLLVGRLLRGLRSFKRVELHYAPRGADAEVQVWLRAGWLMRPQRIGDLGARMNAAFEEAFARGARRVCLIGSDCPLVQPADVREAWKKLRQHDVVLGPAQDGGYWLVALRRPEPRLFENIAWSTSTVLERTQARAARLGLSVALLRTLRDIDTWEDWQWFRKLPQTRTGPR